MSDEVWFGGREFGIKVSGPADPDLRRRLLEDDLTPDERLRLAAICEQLGAWSDSDPLRLPEGF